MRLVWKLPASRARWNQPISNLCRAALSSADGLLCGSAQLCPIFESVNKRKLRPFSDLPPPIPWPPKGPRVPETPNSRPNRRLLCKRSSQPPWIPIWRATLPLPVSSPLPRSARPMASNASLQSPEQPLVNLLPLRILRLARDAKVVATVHPER